MAAKVLSKDYPQLTSLLEIIERLDGDIDGVPRIQRGSPKAGKLSIAVKEYVEQLKAMQVSVNDISRKTGNTLLQSNFDNLMILLSQRIDESGRDEAYTSRMEYCKQVSHLAGILKGSLEHFLQPSVENVTDSLDQLHMQSAGTPVQPGHRTGVLLSTFGPLALLGKGAFGVVYKATHKLDNQEYAIKIIKLPSDPKCNAEVQREVDALAKLKHDNIVVYNFSWTEEAPPIEADRAPLWDILQNLSSGKPNEPTSSQPDISSVDQQSVKFTALFIVTELCSRTLEEWLNTENRVRGTIVHFFKQMLSAVSYIHGQGLFHRDLKPANIFMTAQNVIKVGDFGLVTNQGQNVGDLGQVNNQGHSVDVGTPPYQSPELILSGSYDAKVDIYALGIIFFLMIYPTGGLFGQELNEIFSALKSKQKKEFPNSLQKHETERTIILKMIDDDPLKRPTADEVLNGEYLKALIESDLDLIYARV